MSKKEDIKETDNIEIVEDETPEVKEPKHGKEPEENTEDVKVEKVYSQKEVEMITQELLKAKKERDQYLEMAQRQKAEFDNYRKRSEQQRLEANGNGKRDAITAILPVLDNMERALATCADIPEDDALKQGVTMVFNQFDEVLKAQGMQKIEALGEAFDPNFHHAVMEGEANDEYPAGTVMAVMQDGYMVNEKIIRYAMVKVAK